MKKYPVKIGVACLARFTYDAAAAVEIYETAQKDMRTIENVNWVIVPEQVISQEDAKSAAERMLAKNVDGVAIISGTFHLGHLALLIDHMVQKPILL